MPADSPRPRSGAVERGLSIALRTAHLVAVIVLGAALLGAPVDAAAAGWAALGSGAVLMAMELVARRMSLLELAGLAMLVKIGALAWVALAGRHAIVLFWALVVLSAITSHAPKHVRHWRPARPGRPGRPGRRDSRYGSDSRDSSAGRPG